MNMFQLTSNKVAIIVAVRRGLRSGLVADRARLLNFIEAIASGT